MLRWSQDSFSRPGKRRKIPRFVKRWKFSSVDGVNQVISPNGVNSFELKKRMKILRFTVGASLFMVLLRQELFKCLRQTLVDRRSRRGVYESTPQYGCHSRLSNITLAESNLIKKIRVKLTLKCPSGKFASGKSFDFQLKIERFLGPAFDVLAKLFFEAENAIGVR